MYKMIVVDDSEMTRQGIRASVNWEVMDVRIVGEAADGLEAMVLIHDTDPDIIICDIRMPKLDGIALINEVLPSHPSLQVIFFSGYSDKEYLKNAIKLEAVDYLYKPLQLHELIGAVEKAKKKCMNKKVHLTQNEADLALSLLQCSENEIPSDLPLDLHAPLVTVIVQMNTAGEHMADRAYDNQLDDLLLASRHYLAFQTVAARVFDGKFVMSCAGKGYILHANVSQDFLNRKTAEVKLSPFFTTLDSGQADVVVGVSNLCTDFKYLREAYDEARAAVRAAFLLGYGRVIFYRDLSQKPFVPSQDMQRELYDRILANDFIFLTAILIHFPPAASRIFRRFARRSRPSHIGSAVRASGTSRTVASIFRSSSTLRRAFPSCTIICSHNCKSTSTVSRTSITKVASCLKWSSISRKTTIRNSPFVRSPSAFS